MKHVVIMKPGGFDQFMIKDDPNLAPARGHVIVNVEVIGINYADCIARMGLYQSARKFVDYGQLISNNYTYSLPF